MNITINRKGKLVIEDAEIFAKNFTGNERKFNAKGVRNFCVFIDEENAPILKNAGWNIKETARNEDDDTVRYYLPVEVRYNGENSRFPDPSIIMFFEGRVTPDDAIILTEKSVAELDHNDIVTCDIIINPRVWLSGNEEKIKAYLSSMRVVIEENELKLKYGI